jgi:hypothetical protein
MEAAKAQKWATETQENILALISKTEIVRKITKNHLSAGEQNLFGKKVKLSPYRPWRPLGLREVEAPTFSDIRLIDSGKVVVSPTRRPLFTPRNFPGTHFC